MSRMKATISAVSLRCRIMNASAGGTQSLNSSRVSSRQTKLVALLESHWRLSNRMTEADWLLKSL